MPVRQTGLSLTVAGYLTVKRDRSKMVMSWVSATSKSDLRGQINLMMLMLLLQSATNTANNNIAQAVPLEKQPAEYSLIFMGGFVLTGLILLISLFRYRRRRSTATVAQDLPTDVRKRLGTSATNRGLKILRLVFVLLTLAVFSFHVYWARYAETRNEKFQELSYKDLRNRRLGE